jgi:hypothetical protein
VDTSIADEQAHSEVLQSMEDTLTKESKACPTIAYALNELVFMDLSLDDAVASSSPSMFHWVQFWTACSREQSPLARAQGKAPRLLAGSLVWA